ncbi:MAG: response regulator [Desulfobacteraceae bacterium]|jgi:DNA-binding NtrC family response regulator
MKNIKVLFVDDEEEFVQLLAERARLKKLGTEIALDGSEALAKLGEKLPDVMVLDFMLADIDGLTVLEQVKSKYPEVQVIMLTAKGNPEIEEKARAAGAFDYLEKPVDFNKLRKIIEKAYQYKQTL